MATRVFMPKLGMAMKEGMLAKWVKEDGETVQVDDTLAIIVTKKITYELKTSVSGILRHSVRAQETKSIGTVIGWILAPGEAIPDEEPGLPAPEMPVTAQSPSQAPLAATAQPAAAQPGPATVPAGDGFVVASPAARRLARELQVELGFLKGTGPGGRVTEEDVRCYQEARQQVSITSTARKMADELKLDVLKIQGTGSGGRITEEDIQHFLNPPAPPPVTKAAPTPAAAPPANGHTVPFSGMRAMIAENMTSSLQSMAQVTATTEVDVTDLVALRERLKKDFNVTYTDLLVKAVTIALNKHPRLNASLDGDVIRLHETINIGVGVALDEGLIVPVIHSAGNLNVQQIGEKVRDLAAKARSNTLDMDEVTGGTFTITNLGNFGIDAFTPVINPPEAAILGVGRIVEKVVVHRGEIARRAMMVLSLTFDHRIVDGAPAAAFLQTLSDLLTHPYFIGAGAC